MRWLLPTLLLAMCACGDAAGPSPDSDGRTWLLPAPVVGSAFGQAVALGQDGEVWAGAPFEPTGGAVYRWEDGELRPDSRGAVGYGWALAADTALLLTSPLEGAGSLRRAGQEVPLLAGGVERVGAALAAEGGDWVVSEGAGWRRSDGQRGQLPERPAALAIAAGSLGIALASGEAAAVIDGEPLPRAEAGEGAGRSIAAGDFDGDGITDWALGGGGSVTLWQAGAPLPWIRLSGPGGFGAAVAFADLDGDGAEELAVGSPDLAGFTGLVTVHHHDAPTAAWRTWIGHPGSELGSALAGGPGLLLMGAPGGAGGALLWRASCLSE